MLLNQPRGLYYLFFTEMWERFGFMTMQTLLVLYLSHALHFSDAKAYLLAAAFSAFQWITPVPGGYMADRYIGFQRAILIGGSILAIGYLFMSMPGYNLFLIGMALLILGNGFFKPNVSSIVGTLYTRDDPRRDSGFTIFYMGINVGQILPPLFLGKLVDHFGWHAGFLLAAIGMILSLIIFLKGKHVIGHGSERPSSQFFLSKQTRVYAYSILGITLLAGLVFFTGALFLPHESNIILMIAAIIIVVSLVRIIFKLERKPRNNMLACIILIIVSIGFWAVYFQCFSSLLLFADRNMSPNFLGMHIDAEFTEVFNPLFIFVMSPFFSLLWPWLNKKNWNPSYPTKFMLGSFFIAAGFILLGLGVKYFSQNGLSSPWWLTLSYFLQTCGELVLSPIGLAMITRLSPPKYVGMMMGVWFLALAAASALAGYLATLTAMPKNTDAVTSSHIYMNAFFSYGWLAVIMTIISILLIRPLKRLINT